jgi:predicted AlkP superfamily phosphohydrolase/phosphomutase
LSGRVLLIGLDSADADLIEDWSASGHLPTFAALRRDGLWSRLRTTAEIMHVSAWPTIYTGVNPGHHGLYHAYQVRAGEQRIHRTDPSWCARKPFWHHLDAEGRRCIVLDAFMDTPLPGYRGIQVLDYGTWTWFGGPRSVPSDLLEDMVRRFGPYPGPEHMDVTHVPADIARFRDGLVAGVRHKAEVTRWLMREHDWDLLFVTFSEPHGAGHYLWHAGDPDYPLQLTGGLRGQRPPLLDVYRALDEALEAILAETDRHTTVLVVSGDGMGPNYSGCNHVAPMLSRMGLLESLEGGSHKGGWLKRLRGTIPMPVRQAITRCLPKAYQHGLATSWMNQGTSWSGTQVFQIPNSNEAYLRLNLQGREPQGILPPGDADAVLRRVQQEFHQATNPDNGMAAAERAVLTSNVFQGAERIHLPDLVVTWNNAARIQHHLESPSCGLVEAKAAHEASPFYTGNHRPVAFVGGTGRHVRQGALSERAHILDIPSTIMALLDVPAPGWFEGRVWNEVLPPVPATAG